HATNAVRRIDHEIALLEGVILRLGHDLLRLGHIKFLHVHPSIPRAERYRYPPRHASPACGPDVRHRLKFQSATDWTPSQWPPGPRTPPSRIGITEFALGVADYVAFRQRSAYAKVAWLAQKMRKRTLIWCDSALAGVLTEILFKLVF